MTSIFNFKIQQNTSKVKRSFVDESILTDLIQLEFYYSVVLINQGRQEIMKNQIVSPMTEKHRLFATALYKNPYITTFALAVDVTETFISTLFILVS